MYKLRDFLTLTFDLLTLGSRHMMRFGCSIALFAGKYRELYTCESYNEGDMQRIIQDVNNMVTEENSSDQKIKSNYFIVRLKVDQRAGQLSLPHLGITKKK